MFFKIATEGNNAVWKYPLMILIVFFAYSLGQMPLVGVLLYKMSQSTELGTDAVADFMANPNFLNFGIDQNVGFLLLLLMFVVAFVAFYFLFPAMHQRSFKTLITYKDKIDWGKILFAFGFWLSLGLAMEAVMYFLHPEAYSFHFSLKHFLPLLLLSIFVLPIQTSMEELIFRGYLMQGIGLATKTRWIPLIVTSVLFGLIHSANPEIAKFGFWTMQAYYVMAGLLLGIITLMDDSMELALGVHAATNFIGAVFVGYDGAAIQTYSLFNTEFLDTTYMIVGFLCAALIFVFICKSKYNWGSFGKLFSPLDLERA